MKVPRRALGVAGVVLAASATTASDDARVALSVTPRAATVGERLAAELTVDAPAGAVIDPPQIGPTLGSLSVTSGNWQPPQDHEGGQRWTWTGELVGFRTGEIEIPAIRIPVEHDGRREVLTTEALSVTIESVLDARDAQVPLADLKPPASIAPDYGALIAAGSILALLLLAAGLLWWLQRRYGARLAAAAVPEDPFHRTPPDVWVYAELKKLLERRLAEEGRVDLFFSELSRIIKRYLGGRFRVELMERTTAEVAPLLRQAGADSEAIAAIDQLLTCCDQVKFAKSQPDAAACRESIESAYRIVDTTKPRREPGDETPERGVA
jgi:hypothetical protein